MWILNKRTRKANLYRDSENPSLFQAEIHARPTNYLNPVDEWIPVVTTPTISSNPDYGFELKTAEYWAFFPEPLLVAPIKFGVSSMSGRGGEDHSFTFEALDVSYWDVNEDDDYLGAPQSVSGGALTNPNRIVYAGAYVGDLEASLEYHLRNFGLKEFVVIDAPPRVPAGYLVQPIKLGFTALIENPTTDLYVDGVKVTPKNQSFVTDKEIEFRDSNGVVRFKMRPPFAQDSNEDPTSIACEVRIRKVGNKVHFTILLPYEWLSDPARIYPVKVDASPETITAGWDCCCNSDLGWLNSCTHVDLIVGKNIVGSVYWRSGIDFDTSIIPDAATITQVDLRIYVNNQRSGALLDCDEMTGGGSPAGKGAAQTYFDASDPSGFMADADGASYLSQDTCIQSNGQYQITLLSAAVTDLQNQLANDWFTVGLSQYDETSKKAELDSIEGDNDPQIVVTFLAAGWKQLQYNTEPPTGSAWNSLKYANEPPVASSWNKLLYEGE